MPTPTITIHAYTTDQLMSEHDQNLAIINRIKQDVAQQYDNISHPIPLFEQLNP